LTRIRFPAHAGIFVISTASRPAQGPTQHPTGGPFPGVKWPGYEADHSPPSADDVNQAWSYTSNPAYASMAWCLIKHKMLLSCVVLR